MNLSPAIFSFKGQKENKEIRKHNEEEGQSYEAYDKKFFEKFNEFLIKHKGGKMVFVNDEDCTDNTFEANIDKNIKLSSVFLSLHRITDKNIESLVNQFIKCVNSKKPIESQSVVEKSKGSIYMLNLILLLRLPSESKVDWEKLKNLEEFKKEKAPRSKRNNKLKNVPQDKEEDINENSFQFFHFLGKFCYNKSKNGLFRELQWWAVWSY